jgi:alcohol dehydrogenase YqhD (iron-dependent ADH family)
MDAYTQLKHKIWQLQNNNDRWIARTDISKTPEFRQELKVRQALLAELIAEIEAIDSQQNQAVGY